MHLIWEQLNSVTTSDRLFIATVHFRAPIKLKSTNLQLAHTKELGHTAVSILHIQYNNTVHCDTKYTCNVLLDLVLSSPNPIHALFFLI